MARIERAAIHEIGHALIAVLLGRQVMGVKLLPSPHTELKRKRILPTGKPKTESERALVEGELMLAVAGIAAERVMQVDDHSSLQGAFDDLQKASQLALQIAGPARAEAAVAHGMSTEERMLRARTDVVSKATAALMKQGALDRKQVESLIPHR